MAINTVNVEAERIYKKKVFSKLVKIAFLLLIIFLSIVYLFLYIVYDGGRFTVSLDKNMSNRKNVYLSEDRQKFILRATNPRYAGDTIVPRDSVLKIFLVKGKVNRRQL